MPAKLCENMRKSCMLGRADANRQASVLFDGRLESATIMQGWGGAEGTLGAGKEQWCETKCTRGRRGGGYNAMSVVQLTLLKVRAAAQEDLSQGSQLHTHSYKYLIEI